PEHQRAEKPLAAARLPPAQRIAVDGAEQDGQHDRGHRDGDRVPEAAADALAADARAGLAPGGTPGVERRRGRQREELAEADLVHALERGRQHHVQRQQEEGRGEDQEGVDAEARPVLGGFALHAWLSLRRLRTYASGATRARTVMSSITAPAEASARFAR